MKHLQKFPVWFSIVCLCRSVPVYETPPAIPELNREFAQLQKYLTERKIIPEGFENGRLAKSLSAVFDSNAPAINALYQQFMDEDVNINSILEMLNQNDFTSVFLPNPNLLLPLKGKPGKLTSNTIQPSKNVALNDPPKVKVSTENVNITQNVVLNDPPKVKVPKANAETTNAHITPSKSSQIVNEEPSSVTRNETQSQKVSSSEDQSASVSSETETPEDPTSHVAENIENSGSNDVSASIEKLSSGESAPGQSVTNENVSVSHSARSPRQDAEADTEDSSEEVSSDEDEPAGGGDGMGGGLLGLLAGLSGGEGGSDLGSLLATVGGIVGQLSGDGFDLNNLLVSAIGLFAGVLGDGSPPGSKIAQYIITVLDTITGGGASNNGMFFGDFLARLITGISAGGDPDESGSQEQGSDSASFFVSLITALLGGSSSGSSFHG